MRRTVTLAIADSSFGKSQKEDLLQLLVTSLQDLFLSSSFVHGVLGQGQKVSKGQPFTIELAQVTRSRVSFIHILCTYILLQITIYILFFILIKCNFLRCSNISRSKGSVHQLATFKVCCRSHQCDYPSILAAYSGKQHSP